MSSDTVVNHKRRLVENVSSLMLLQGANYILPLVTLPYLVRVLGPEKFGLLAFAQAFTQYFIVFTDYGFNLTATRRIAIHQDNLREVSEIFSAVMVIKVGLMFVSFLLMAAAVFAVPKFRADWQVYFVTFLMVVGSVLFPVWYFQGMEKMKYITILNVTARFIATVAIFVFVRKQSDYVLAAAVQSAGLVIAGILGLLSLRRVAPISCFLPPWSSVIDAAREGWHVFVSMAAISLYTSSNAFVLGLVTNTVTVGYFSAADKLVRAVQGAFWPVSQAIYPHINALAARSREVALEFIRRSLRWLGLFSLVASSILFILAEPLVVLLLGRQYTASVVVVRWMAFLPFIIALSNVFGMQTMLTFGMNKLFSRILVAAGLVNLLLIIPLAYILGAEGAAIAVLLTEMLVTLSMGTALQVRGFKLLSVRERVA